MSHINFTCPHCSRLMQLPIALEGKQGKCPSCKAVVTISANAPPSPAVLPQQPLPQQPLQQSLPDALPFQPSLPAPNSLAPLNALQPFGGISPQQPVSPSVVQQNSNKSGASSHWPLTIGIACTTLVLGIILGSVVGYALNGSSNKDVVADNSSTNSGNSESGGNNASSGKVHTPPATDEKSQGVETIDNEGSSMNGGRDTGMSGGMNPTGGTAGNTFRGGKDPLAALNGHWKRTHFYKHDDNDMKDGSMGRMAEDLSDGVFRSKTWSMYYDSASKAWAQVYPDGTIERGTFNVLPDRDHPGKFNMKVIYGDGSGDWKSNSYYLSNSNRQLDDQWIRKFGNGPNAERWVYVDGKTSP